MLKSIKMDYSIATSSTSTSTTKRRINEKTDEDNLIVNKKQKFSIDELLNASGKNPTKSLFLENSSKENLKLQCKLEAENQHLWKMFSKIGTEMIITKPGRYINLIKIFLKT